MQKADFLYDLPDDRIATHPLAQRDHSNLLHFKDGEIRDHRFYELPELLPAGSQLIFNNTRVIKARLRFVKSEGAKPIEIFCLGPHGESVEESMNRVGEARFECLVGNLKRWKDHPLELALDENLTLRAEKVERHDAIWVIHFSWNADLAFSEILERAGQIPLPPYMNREAETDDVDRYQTVYAASNGSVAAPTAGLHFTPEVLSGLKEGGHQAVELTLHVGAGTFKPLGDGDVSDHDMHAEEILVSLDWLEAYLQHDGAKFAVGTTSLRTLESCYWMGVKILGGSGIEPLGQFEAYELPQHYTAKEAFAALSAHLQDKGVHTVATRTQLMIKPGYRMRTTTGIITNFHQPGSTLILLVSAGVGEAWRDIYTHALANNYRFLSYGDSSLLYFRGVE